MLRKLSFSLGEVIIMATILALIPGALYVNNLLEVNEDPPIIPAREKFTWEILICPEQYQNEWGILDLERLTVFYCVYGKDQQIRIPWTRVFIANALYHIFYIDSDPACSSHFFRVKDHYKVIYACG